MAGCGCKSDGNLSDLKSSGNLPKQSINKLIVKYTLKIIMFLLMVVLLPIINLFIIWFIFKAVVLNEDVNIKPLLIAIGNKFKNNDDDDDYDEDDYENLTEDDVVMVDVEEITNSSK